MSQSESFSCSRCGSVEFVSVGKCRKCKVCGKYITWIHKKKQTGWRQWNKGLTKETNQSIADYGRKISETKKSNPKYAKIARENALKSAKLENRFSDSKIQELYDKLGSQHRLAEYLKVSQSAISLFMKRHKIKSNSKSISLTRQTDEQKKDRYRKISKSLKGNTNWRFSYQYPNSEEQKLIRFFNKWNLPFKYVGDGSFKIGGKCPDFINEEQKLIIEFFGELWHKESDELTRIKFFGENGWRCLVIWGKQVGRYETNKTYNWERILDDRIVRWMAGIK